MRENTRSGRWQANRLSNRARHLLMVAAGSVLAVHAGVASAQSTYTGGGTTAAPLTGDWNTASNWSPSGIPAGGITQTLSFLGGTTAYTSTDDISGTFALNQLTLGSNSSGTVLNSSSGSNLLSFQGTTPLITQTTTQTFTVAAPVDLPTNAYIAQVTGGEIDFTGNVTTSASGGLALSNTNFVNASNNSTVKFFGANTFNGLTVNSNVTAVAGLSTNLATLGAGTVTLNGGTLLLQGQQSSGINQQQPIGISGFNADTIIDAANAPGYATKTGVAFLGINPSGTVYQSSTGVLTTDVSAPGEVHNQTVFFQNGWSKNGNQTGLPASGYFSSAFTNVNSAHTTFFFGYNGSSIDYADNNTFSFNNASSGALTATLASPGVAANLDFLATSTVATNFDVTLNFNTGSPSLYTSGISTGPLATGGGPANVALANIKGTNNGNSNDIDNGGIGAMHLTESDITLLPGDANRSITSITFTPTSGVTTPTTSAVAEIYAVSGFGTFAPFLFPAQSYTNNISVTADSVIAVSTSLTASVGNLAIGSNKLSVTSPSATVVPYSLTTGSVTLSGNATFDNKNSSGGGVGTLNLGALSDGGSAYALTINTDSGLVALTAAGSLSSGTTISVPTGSRLTVAAGGAIGSATVNVTGGTVNGTDPDGATSATGGLYNVASGALNVVSLNGLGALAQVTMAGGTLTMSGSAQVSSLNNTGTAGTLNLSNQYLTVGNTDNLNSSFGGPITATTGSNLIGALGKSGNGSFTVSGTTNNQLFTGTLQGALIVGGNSTVAVATGAMAYNASQGLPVHGLITGPLGSGFVIVGPGGGPANSQLYLDTPGRTLPNPIFIGSGGSGALGTAEATVGGLNTTGVTTYAGDITLGAGDTGSFGVTGRFVLGASAGGEVDVTGNILANHDTSHTEVTVRNLTSNTGTGAIVKTLGQNNTYRLGTEIDPNVTYVSALSQSTRTLGYGPVILAGGTLAIQGQLLAGTQAANLVTNAGFNQKLIVPVGASNASSATTATIDGASVLYQNGYVNINSSTGATGVNASGLYTSEYNPSVQFQLQQNFSAGTYTVNNALQFKSGTFNTGTLTLTTPAAFSSIQLLSMNGNGPTSIAVTFNFSGGTTETQTLVTQNWFVGHINNVFGPGSPSLTTTARLAIGGLGPNGVATGASVNGSATNIGSIQRSNDAYTNNPASMFEDDYTLLPADQSKILNTITFTVTNYNGLTSTDNIMAVSGQTYVAPSTLATQTYANNVDTTGGTANVPGGTIDVTGSLNAVMGNNLKMGDSSLTVISSDGTTNPYSLTLATLPDTIDNLNSPPEVTLLGSIPGQGPTFNVSNSAGGGAGTVILGPLDDNLALEVDQVTPCPQTITKIGTGSLTLSKPAILLQTGTTFNVNSGILNSNDPTAMGTMATVNVTSTLNFGANDNTGAAPVPVTLAALNVSGTGLVAVLNTPTNVDRTVLVITGPNNLSIAVGGTVDLNANDMIVQGGNLTTITAAIKSGFNAGVGYWNGAGITSTSAHNNSTGLTALGVMASTGAAFDGQPTTAGDVLVKYTYYGDTNLDAKVDGTDYSRIDNAYLADLTNANAFTGWFNGDLNYDGVINGSDYTLIDNAFNSQGAQITSAIAAVPTAELAGGSGSSSDFGEPSRAVPEPTTLALLGIGAVGLLGRKSRRRR